MTYAKQNREAELLAVALLRQAMPGGNEDEAAKIVDTCQPANLGYLAFQLWWCIQRLLEDLDDVEDVHRAVELVEEMVTRGNWWDAYRGEAVPSDRLHWQTKHLRSE